MFQRIKSAVAAALVLSALIAADGNTQDANRPATAKINEPKSEAAQAALPVEPNPRLQIQYVGMMGIGLTVDNNITLCCGPGAIRTNFKIDGRVLYPNTRGQEALPPGPGGRKRNGLQATWTNGDLTFTQIIEIVPSQARGDKKRYLDTALVRYVVENKGDKPRNVGARVHIDTMCNGNDGALFAAPTHPGKVLDGIELKGKTFPEYVQILERPDLKNPGFVGHFTLKMTGGLIGPDRFICTAHGADNGWDLQVLQANGDSDCAIFWEPRDVPPRSKVEFAYGYGKGIATLPENEGRVKLALSGNFEPGKIFTITAYVDEPLARQTLALQLPAELQLVDGREMQPVPPAAEGSATSVVTWKARVLQLGSYDIRIRSSNGVTKTWPVTISR